MERLLVQNLGQIDLLRFGQRRQRAKEEEGRIAARPTGTALGIAGYRSRRPQLSRKTGSDLVLEVGVEPTCPVKDAGF
jgi:hypothetical protein